MSERNHGDLLYQLLPTVFRARDNSERGPDGRVVKQGDLQKYLAACGELLDLFHATLEQKLADNFPLGEKVGVNRPPQNWILPYFAELLDVQLLAPDAAGRREEVANAVAWRQRKGTPPVVEQIAEAVGQLDVEVQEGWKRVAVTPRIGDPLVSSRYFGLRWELHPDYHPDGDHGLAEDPGTHPSDMARHPGFPAVTPDFRRPPGNVRNTHVSPETPHPPTDPWKPVPPHPTPDCRGTHLDITRRTPDMRDPTWQYGHYTPYTVLVYYRIPEGFFPEDCNSQDVGGPPDEFTVDWGDLEDTPGFEYDFDEATGKGWAKYTPEVPNTVLRVSGEPKLSPGVYTFENIRFISLNLLKAGTYDLGGLVVETSCTLAQVGVHHIQNLVLGGDLAAATSSAAGRIQLDLECCALSSVSATFEPAEDETSSSDFINIIAKSCLFGSLATLDATLQLEYCTVLGNTTAGHLDASDCIFQGLLFNQAGVEDFEPDGAEPDFLPEGCLRYCRVTEVVLEAMKSSDTTQAEWLNRDSPPASLPHSESVFFVASEFGEPGCAVLHPSSSNRVCFGAEDGGELGAFHDSYHCLRREAIAEKLNEFLPVSVQAVLIPDRTLWIRSAEPTTDDS